jgi:hypothetical protein
MPIATRSMLNATIWDAPGCTHDHSVLWLCSGLPFDAAGVLIGAYRNRGGAIRALPRQAPYAVAGQRRAGAGARCVSSAPSVPS